MTKQGIYSAEQGFFSIDQAMRKSGRKAPSFGRLSLETELPQLVSAAGSGLICNSHPTGSSGLAISPQPRDCLNHVQVATRLEPIASALTDDPPEGQKNDRSK